MVYKYRFMVMTKLYILVDLQFIIVFKCIKNCFLLSFASQNRYAAYNRKHKIQHFNIIFNNTNLTLKKTKMRKVIYAVGLAASMMLLGCKGDIGPAGINGVANVASITKTTNGLGWTLSSDKKIASQDLAVPEITDKTMLNGDVSVFINSQGENIALPITSSGIVYTYGYKLGVVGIVVYFQDRSLVFSNTSSIPNFDYKITVITK
ncbi:MAG: hypothetical protein EAZ53_00500 [Bacteroidetes bacterium]|nr:MAG: hypothetical protein EAZ53_00500 [Bacteroidota bacterium]